MFHAVLILCIHCFFLEFLLTSLVIQCCLWLLWLLQPPFWKTKDNRFTSMHFRILYVLKFQPACCGLKYTRRCAPASWYTVPFVSVFVRFVFFFRVTVVQVLTELMGIDLATWRARIGLNYWSGRRRDGAWRRSWAAHLSCSRAAWRSSPCHRYWDTCSAGVPLGGVGVARCVVPSWEAALSLRRSEGWRVRTLLGCACSWGCVQWCWHYWDVERKPGPTGKEGSCYCYNAPIWCFFSFSSSALPAHNEGGCYIMQEILLTLAENQHSSYANVDRCFWMLCSRETHLLVLHSLLRLSSLFLHR